MIVYSGLRSWAKFWAIAGTISLGAAIGVWAPLYTPFNPLVGNTGPGFAFAVYGGIIGVVEGVFFANLVDKGLVWLASVVLTAALAVVIPFAFGRVGEWQTYDIFAWACPVAFAVPQVVWMWKERIILDRD